MDATPLMAVKKSHCHRGHPLSGDNLYVAPSGIRNCRACHRIYRDKWAETNRDQYLEMHRVRAAKYRTNPANKEKIKKAKKRLNQTEKYKTAAKLRVDRWRENNKDKFLAQRRDYHERNRDRLAEYHRELYRSNNPAPAIRRVAKQLKDGSIDIASAVKQIRELADRVHAKSDEVLRGNQES